MAWIDDKVRRAEDVIAAARALLENLDDAHQTGPEENPATGDYPRDEDGRPWFHDTWDLRQALKIFDETPKCPRVIVAVRGGVVTCISSDILVEAEVLDYDNAEGDEEYAKQAEAMEKIFEKLPFTVY